MTPDISGRLFEMPWAVWDPGSSCWRTYAGTSASGSIKSSGTWPTSGSMRDGACFEHPTWAHPTSAPASSSLLGTPSAHPRTHSPRDVDHGIQLANQVALLPTPRTSDMNGARSHGDGGPDPRTTVSLLLPTPTRTTGRNATSGRSNPDSQHHDGWTLEDVFWTGDLTDPPSNGGRPSTDPPRPPLSTGD